MDFLIDTSVLIPAEPTSSSDVEDMTPVLAEFLRLVQRTGSRAWQHPDAFRELANDRDSARRKLRSTLARKYMWIEPVPDVSLELAEAFDSPEPGTHDWYDARLLEAVRSGASDFLVSDDIGLHHRSRAVGLQERVLTASDALDLVRQLYEPPPQAPPAARATSCDQLNPGDSLFDDLRADYPTFDNWLRTAASERRPAWVIENASGAHAALCIIKEETPGEHGLAGKLMKLCTFKVSDAHRGTRFGELLLKAVFDHAAAHGYDVIFLEARPDKGFLFDFVEQFGFRRLKLLKNGVDPVYAKALRPDDDDPGRMDPLAFHIAYGPPRVLWQDVPGYIVPIQPPYHARLFPEAEQQLSLAAGAEAHGNGIRKAYLSKASIRTIAPGDLLFFYRSVTSELTVLGVAEDVAVLSDALDILRATGKRTLYPYESIEGMTRGGRPVLVIGFRQAKVVEKPVPYAELQEHGVLRGRPQAVQRIGEEAAKWLAKRLRL